MALLAKVKQFLGIGTLSVKLQVPPHFQASDTTIDGSLLITAKSDQSILKIEVEMIEDFQTGRGEEKKEKRFTLGTLRLTQPFDMKQGETRTVDFSVPFRFLKSSNDQLKEKGGMMGTIGKMGAWAENEKSQYALVATVDVKGATLDPNDRVDLKLVK